MSLKRSFQKITFELTKPSYFSLASAKQLLSWNLLEVVGIRKIGDDYFIVNEDILKKQDQIMEFLPQVCLVLTVPERRRLYHIDRMRNPALSITHCILKAVGHPLKRSRYPYPEEGLPVYRWKITTKHMLDVKLLTSNIMDKAIITDKENNTNQKNTHTTMERNSFIDDGNFFESNKDKICVH